MIVGVYMGSQEIRTFLYNIVLVINSTVTLLSLSLDDGVGCLSCIYFLLFKD